MASFIVIFIFIILIHSNFFYIPLNIRCFFLYKYSFSLYSPPQLLTFPPQVTS